MREHYEQMKEDLDRHEKSRVRGLSSREVVAKSYTDSELQQLVSDLSAKPLSAVATFRLYSFIFEHQEDRIPAELRRVAADSLADYIQSLSDPLDESATAVFICWGAHRTDHRSICLSLLRHPSISIRSIALSCAAAFLHTKDYPVLFEFRQDNYVSEIGMGGPLHYVLRDHALHVLKQLTKFPGAEGSDCFEDTSEGRVSYQSWSAFVNWYERRQR